MSEDLYAAPVVFPLTLAQQRMWTVEQLVPGTAAYHLSFALRLTGSLDRAALGRAAQAVIARHEALRTSFTEVEGQVVQVVNGATELTIPMQDLAEDDVDEARLADLLAAEGARPFDLSTAPLVRLLLVRLSAREHVLVVTMHHLVSDMWSLGIFARDVEANYVAELAGAVSELPTLPVQFGDVAVWEHEHADARRTPRLVDYWTERLADVPAVLDLPLDRHRPPERHLRGASVAIDVPAATADAIARLTHECAATPFMVLLAAFQVVLARHCGSTDIVVGTGLATRTPETEDVIGCFVNIVALRTSLAGDPSFRELVERVRQTALGAYEHKDLPFETLVAALGGPPSLSHTPLVQALFVLQNAPSPVLALPGLGAHPVPVGRSAAQLDVNLQLWPAPEAGFTGFLEYDSELFDADTMRRMVGHIETVLDAAVSEPGLRLSALPMLTHAEQVRAETWNATRTDYPAECGVPELIERAAASTPDAPALISPHETITYAELATRADTLARRLRAHGVGPDRLVGVLRSRGIGCLVAVLATLKAGGAYLPLDPAYPRERIAFMLADASPVAIIAEPGLLDQLPDDAAHLVVSEDGDAPDVEPACPTDPDQLAYVIYTSGSTGRPKGIAVPHRGVVNNLTDLNRIGEVGPGDRVLALSSPSFDMSVYETLGVLAAGGAIVLPDPARAGDPEHWVDLVLRHEVSVWNTAPALAENLVRVAESRGCALSTLRLAFFGGDWMPLSLPERLRAMAPAMRIVVCYGLTEVSIHSATTEVGEVPPDWTSVPAGRPMANQQVFVFDRDGLLAPVGVPGEICVSGVGLARGYHHRPGLTAGRFVPHPLSGQAGLPIGSRLYRSGDRGRYLRDGVVELLGRNDNQVKIRGFRVEAGEVAAALKTHPDVQEAVVKVDRHHAAGPRLVAYYRPREDAAPSTEQLREYLTRHLPLWMLPSVFVRLADLPLSASGKVDLARLPDPEPARPDLAAEFVAPADDVERGIAALWESVLDVRGPGVRDDFFDLGGHSLAASRLVSQLRAVFGVQLPLRALFTARTIAEQGVVLREAGVSAGVDIPAVAALVMSVAGLTEDQARRMLAEDEQVTR